MTCCPSVHLSVNIGRTNLEIKTFRVHTWSVETLGDWLLPILELGHSDPYFVDFIGQSLIPFLM